LVGTQHRAGGDAEGEGIADLAGGAGDCDIQGLLHLEFSTGKRARILRYEGIEKAGLDSDLVL
jgi:ABC-type sugar transport system substrate-binding protein